MSYKRIKSGVAINFQLNEDKCVVVSFALHCTPKTVRLNNGYFTVGVFFSNALIFNSLVDHALLYYANPEEAILNFNHLKWTETHLYVQNTDNKKSVSNST